MIEAAVSCKPHFSTHCFL